MVKSEPHRTFLGWDTTCSSLFIQSQMAYCAIVCEVIFVLLKIPFFFLLSNCTLSWSVITVLLFWGDWTTHVSPSPYKLFWNTTVNVTSYLKIFTSKRSQKKKTEQSEGRWVVQRHSTNYCKIKRLKLSALDIFQHFISQQWSKL